MQFILCCLLSVFLSDVLSAADREMKSIRIELPDVDHEVVLSGPDSDWQLIVSGISASGDTLDVTGEAQFEVEPLNVVNISDSGLMTPRTDGLATVRVRMDQREATVRVLVRDIAIPRQLSFMTDIAPILTRYGCNSGGCHGKQGGQQGFELALLGFQPERDYERLISRVDFDEPDQSDLLLKATKASPHGGGKRFEKDSPAFRLLHRWIAQGAPRDGAGAVTVKRLEILPAERILERNSRQQLNVLAHLSDRTVRDVGRLARFEVNQPDIIGVKEHGIVAPGSHPGAAAVMVRYQSHVGVFRAIVPTGRIFEARHEPLNFIDSSVFRQHRRIGVPVSPECDHATFIRRATIDIAGRLPTVDEVSTFIADTRADRYSRLIDRLLDSEDHADYFAGKWSALLHNRRNTEKDPRAPTQAFFDWIRESIRNDRPYDRIVHGVLTATGQETRNPPVVWYRTANEPSALLEDVAQLFLGQRIQCARCHHHPFEQWSEQDYYGLAAFFSRIQIDDPPKQKKQKQKPPLNVSFKPGHAEARHPLSGDLIPPTPLGSPPLAIPDGNDPREALVEWMTGPDNRFFARVLVNRYWKHFMGRGLVEPEDDLRLTNPPTNSALLDALALHFVQSKFSLRKLVRAICLSRTYRLSAEPDGINLQDRQNYSRFLPRRINAEVMLDAIDNITLSRTRLAGVAGDVRAIQFPDNQTGSYFLSTFGRPAGMTVCECERTSSATLAQQLHMINSPEILEKVTGERARQLSVDRRTHAERIRELYLIALSREPRERELKSILSYLKEQGVIAPEHKTVVKQDTLRNAGPQTEIQIVTVRSSGESGNHSAVNAFDGDPGTRWSVNGTPHWVQFDLSDTATVNELRVGFDKGSRRYRFDLTVSTDGRKWKKLKSFVSSGKGNDVETFAFEAVSGHRFRLVHQGNSENTWSNIHTIEFPGIKVNMATLALSSPGQSSSDPGTPPGPLAAAHQSYADIIWALINTKEFQFNH